MQALSIVVGAAVLLFGRSLFWLFVGGVGFIVGFDFASRVAAQQPEWLILLIALGVGLLGALASIFLERVVIGIAGFFAGGYFASAAVMATSFSNQPTVSVIVFVVGGIIGAVLVTALLDPALILLSALVGATAISQNIPAASSTRMIVFVVLLAIGIAVQAAHYARTRKRPPPELNEGK